MRTSWMIAAVVVVLGGGYVAYMNVVPDAADTQEDTMMKDDAMMDGNEGEWTDEEMRAMEDGTMMKEEDGMMGDETMKKEDAPTKVEPVDGSYGAYSPSVLANGQKKVLFFHAAWCPVCRHADTQLTAWYTTHPFPISVYRVDYDTSADLKAKYGVTYQHTYVLVDGQGNALKVLQGPSDAELQALLQA